MRNDFKLPIAVMGAACAVGVLAMTLGAFADSGRNQPTHPVVVPAGFAPMPPPAPAPFLPRPAFDPSRHQPATPAAGRVLDVLTDIQNRMTQTRYQHQTVVRERSGVFLWDCSGMSAWVLRRAAPRAMSAVNGTRPVARDFYRAIERAPTGSARRGWQRLGHIAEARPGDVFAWLRPADWPPRNTGHVGFILTAPEPVPGIEGAYSMRIADATSVPHQDDTRGYPGEGGFGSGTILFTTDGHGTATAYGWHGTRTRWVVPTTILFGRVTR